MLRKSLILLIILLSLVISPLFSDSSQVELIQTIEQLIESNEQLIERIEYLEELNTKLNSDNELLRTTVEENSITISGLKKRIELDGEEIKGLRDTITSLSTQIDEDKNSYLGVGVSYPLGGTITYGIRPDNFPIGGFVSGNINKESGVLVSLGVSYSF